jgi:hypothetical protein
MVIVSGLNVSTILKVLTERIQFLFIEVCNTLNKKKNFADFST